MTQPVLNKDIIHDLVHPDASEDGSLITMLVLVREAVGRLSGTSGICGFIRGLDASLETLTSSSTFSANHFTALEQRAATIGHRDNYHNGCSGGLKFAAKLGRLMGSLPSN